MKHIISFSGGKDSTALLLKMLEKGMMIDEIVFCDTGVEFPQMYKHINKVGRFIKRPITRLKSPYTFEYLMFEYVKKKGKKKGSRGYSWPDFRVRWCTYYFKRRLWQNHIRKYKGHTVIEYHGITLDEAHRTNRNKDGRNIKYPLVDWGMTGKDCLDFCYKAGFDWDGLYKKLNRVSCYLCPLQRLSELKVIYKDFPELWQRILWLDLRSIKQFGLKFRNDYSILDLEEKFDVEDRQLCVF